VSDRCSWLQCQAFSVQNKNGAYSLTTSSGEEHQFAGILDVAGWGDGQCFWMKRFRELYGVSSGYSLFADDPPPAANHARHDAVVSWDQKN